MLKHILELMKNDADKGKIYLYGTHDINIVNTLRAMGFTNELFKLDLGVSLIYELRIINGGQDQEIRVGAYEQTYFKNVFYSQIWYPSCMPMKIKDGRSLPP